MQYYLNISVRDKRFVESYYEAYADYDSLEETEKIYNQFDGKEFFDIEELNSDDTVIIYTIQIYSYEDDEITGFIKGKYKSLDLTQYHPDFWKLFNLLNSINHSEE